MTFAKMMRRFRDTSQTYGGAPHLLETADQLDRALSAFWKEQTPESLRVLNGAFARAWKEFKFLEPHAASESA